VRRYLTFPFQEQTRVDEGPLRNMIGVQFYFDSEVQWVRGHTMLSDSPWGIALVSQPQFWGSRPRNAAGYIGVVSAAFSHFDVEGSTGLKARECTREQIAREVWRQILEAEVEPSLRDAVPEPALYYVDSALRFSGAQLPASENETPYLVNHAGQWKLRPGRRKDGRYLYDVQVGRMVFAGVFMRTHTRLTSMESANESARHAVNAVLRHSGSAAMPCGIFDLETREWDDAETFKDVDRRLLQRGGRHPMDSPFSRMAIDAVPWNMLKLARGRKR